VALAAVPVLDQLFHDDRLPATFQSMLAGARLAHLSDVDEAGRRPGWPGLIPDCGRPGWSSRPRRGEPPGYPAERSMRAMTGMTRVVFRS
jgi:hypothetical protein